MDDPATPKLALDPGFETLAPEFFYQRRRQKWRNYGQTFIISERIDGFSNSFERFTARRQNRSNIECFESSRHRN